jgi:predicted O-methyltransferase YrrM
MSSSVPRGVLASEAARSVIARLRAEGDLRDREAKRRIATAESDAGGGRLSVVERAVLCREAPIAVTEEVAALLYVLTRRGGGRIVEFGGSLGISTIHLAAGLLDHGQGSLITTEIDPVKAGALSANLSEAGLAEIVEVRVGDAMETLRSLPGTVDLLCLDGWNELYLPVLQLVAPRLSPDALVVADLSADDPDLEPYLRHVRGADSAWMSVTLPLDAGVELSLARPSAGQSSPSRCAASGSIGASRFHSVSIASPADTVEMPQSP